MSCLKDEYTSCIHFGLLGFAKAICTTVMLINAPFWLGLGHYPCQQIFNLWVSWFQKRRFFSGFPNWSTDMIRITLPVVELTFRECRVQTVKNCTVFLYYKYTKGSWLAPRMADLTLDLHTSLSQGSTFVEIPLTTVSLCQCLS